MHLYRSPWSSFLPLLVAAGASLLGAGCSPQIEAPAPAALRRAFPEQAAAVLGQGEGFVATERGFARSAPSQASAWSRVEAELPSGGEGSIRLLTRGGFEVRVREIGAAGAGSLVEHAVAYPRVGGTAYWTVTPGGVEEWLHLKGARGEVAAAWEVEGAALEQRGEQVAVVDAAGVAQLWVSAPRAYAAGGRLVRVGLRVEGARIELSVEADGEEVLVDPAWTMVGSEMKTARAEHSATLLPNGKVLVVGGAASLKEAEVYDAKMLTWKPILQSLTTGRTKPAVARLGNGNLLVVGDADKSLATAKSVELYDWLMDSWSNKTGMTIARQDFRATLLSDGQHVLVAGGGDPTAELYDSKSDTWTAAGAMSTDRYASSATLLGDGKVLVVGGVDKDQSALKSAELFDPVANTWSLVGALAEARAWHVAALLGNGRVLVVGGEGEGKSALKSAELFDPVANTWSSVRPMTDARLRHTATLLASGSVLVVGGSNGKDVLASAEVYDPGTNTWPPAGRMGIGRKDHTATLFANGSVLIAGGVDGAGVPSKSSELYAPSPLGEPCTASDECQSGHCVASVCCNTACDANPCEACGDGICKPVKGTSCDDGNPCTASDKCDENGSCVGDSIQPCKSVDKPGGHSIPDDAPDFTLCASKADCANVEGHPSCVDGVCCNTECKDRCKSCVLEHSIGECTAQLDRDLRHECHTGYFCNATCQLDAMGNGVCEMATTRATCAESECSDDEVHGVGPASCAEDPATKALSCATDTRVPFDCTPFRCIKALGFCRAKCNSIDDCAPGFVCDDEGGKCVPPPAKADGLPGGCALAAGGAAGDAAGLGAFGVALLAAWRRRRERRPGPRRQAMM